MPVPKAIAFSRLPAIPLASSPGSPANSSAIRSVSLALAFRIVSRSMRRQYTEAVASANPCCIFGTSMARFALTGREELCLNWVCPRNLVRAK